MKKWLYLFRKSQNSAGVKRTVWHNLFLKCSEKHGIEFDYPLTVGAGLYIGHTYGITVNDKVVIGNPARIISREKATEAYINNIFGE